MTLDTAVLAVGPVDPHELFHQCRELLGATGQHTWRSLPSYRNDGAFELANQSGAGLGALLAVEYREGEPLRTVQQALACDPGICADGCDASAHPPAGWAEAHLETEYGYQDEQGRSGSRLHAELIFALGGFFEERDIEWGWRNDYTGEWHFADRYEALSELCENGAEGMAWFASCVRPHIETGPPPSFETAGEDRPGI